MSHIDHSSKGERTPLVPLRHVQGDFFVCDIFDAAPKGDIASMAHPIFTLSTKPDVKLRRYESPDGLSYVEIRPNIVGLATVHDRDILIYCISQVMAALNNGQQVHRTLRFKPYDLLVATNRQTGGSGYIGLRASLERLQGTSIETNITTGGVEQIEAFSLIDRYRIVKENKDGRMLDLEVTLSDWVFNAIRSNDVLTLNRRYFQLRKPLERRLYELARKHCGQQSEWKCGLEKLQARAGSLSQSYEFKRLVKDICNADIEHDHMPDYEFRLEGDIVVVKPKPEFIDRMSTPQQDPITGGYIMTLSLETLEKARDLAPTWDIQMLVKEWRIYAAKKKAPPKNPNAAFLGFCKAWFDKRGRNGW